MGKLKLSNNFAAPEGPAEDLAHGLAVKAKKKSEEVEQTPPHLAIRHPDMRDFWGKCLRSDEVSWDTFWLHFPTGLAPEVFVDTAFSSQKERAAFQKAVHSVGSPEHVTVALIDAAFPPGCPVGDNVRRLLKEVGLGNSMAHLPTVLGQHIPIGLQCGGFWDELPASLPRLTTLCSEVEAEMSFADGERSSVAQVLGHVGSGAVRVAVDTAHRLLARKFWSAGICVRLQGACTAEIAAARVATALGILSFPVIVDELLRLTAFLHSRSDQQGRLGIVLDAEGCSRADELHGLSVLVTTLVKAGGSNLQIIVAGEGSLELSRSASCATFHILQAERAGEIAHLTTNVRGEYLQGSAPAVAAACGHQAALLDLAIANLQAGTVSPQNLIKSVSSAMPAKPDAVREKADVQVATALIKAILSELPPNEREALFKLSVLPAAFQTPLAAKALGYSEGEELDRLLGSLHKKGFVRCNVAFQSYGLPQIVKAVVRTEACRSAPAAVEAAVVAFVEYSLVLVESVAALNASNAQVAAMWVIDREREVLDELVNLLHNRNVLPAVTTAVYAEIVSSHMDLLGFRLSMRQQQELCIVCAQASRQQGDMLGEANCLQHLGQIGNAEAADAAMAKAMSTVERALTADHPVVAEMLLSRARLQTQAGNFYQAERLLQRSLEIQQRYMESNSMAVVATRTRLAGALICLSAPERAQPHLQTALEATLKELGPTHPDTALAQCRLASCHADLGQYDVAQDLYLNALDGWRESLGHCHPQFAVLLGQLAFTCCRLDKPDDAEQYYRRSIQMWKEMMVLDQPELQDDLRGLADLLQRQGRSSEAFEIRTQLLKLVEAVRAAQSRATRKASSGRSFSQFLLAPLKACLPTHRTPATVVLPQGIPDSDLDELRAAAKAGSLAVAATAMPIQAEAVELSGVAVPSGGEASQEEEQELRSDKGDVEETVGAVANAGEGADLKKQGTMVVKEDGQASAEFQRLLLKDLPPLSTGPGAVEVKADASRAAKRSPGVDADDTSPGSWKSGKPTPRNHDKAKTAYVPQSAVPFGSKGRGPSAGAVDRTAGADSWVAPTGEASVWAASLRNPNIALANPTGKRTAAAVTATSLSARSDSSGTKNRLFTTTDSRRPAIKHSGCNISKTLAGELVACDSPQAQGDLIPAHTREERQTGGDAEAKLASQTSDVGSFRSRTDRQDSLTSASGYASDDTITDTSQIRVQGSGIVTKEFLGQMNGADPADAVGKSVIGFYNPMFAQYKGRPAERAPVVDDKVEV